MAIGRGRRKEYPNQHCLLLLRVLCNFQLRMRTPKEIPKGVKWPWVTSGSHGTTTKKKNAGKRRGCAEHASGQGHFRTAPLPVTWLISALVEPFVTSVLCSVRKYVLRMCNRKLRNIRPSGAFLTGSDKVTWPEEALSGSVPDRKHVLRIPVFFPRFFS
jgi:hypothetical protein